MRLDEVMESMGEAGEYTGNVNFETLGLASNKTEKRKLTFVDNIKYINDISPDSNVVLTTKEIAESAINLDSFCVCDNPRVLFFRVHNFISGNPDYRRKEFETQTGNNCAISSLSSIAPKNVIIGNNVTIEEFVVIRENTVIGDNTIIRAGVKIGTQGYEFKRSGDIIESVETLGGVIIGKNVEVQYNTCVERATYPWDNTEIGDFTKIGCLVIIGHAVKIKKNGLVVARSGIGGRTEVGANCWIGFGATVINGISVGDNARTNIGSVVTKSVPDNGSVTGNFAIEHNKFIQNLKKQR